MAMSRSQAQRSNNRSRNSQHGSNPHNKDNLKNDRDNTMASKPSAHKDQFGSAHNKDAVKTNQRKTDKPGGNQDLSFRESAQDTHPVRGAANRQPGRRSPAKKPDKSA